MLSCWWFYRKGSEIWANHNDMASVVFKDTVGDSTAKVVKFEQITTGSALLTGASTLVILPQR